MSAQSFFKSGSTTQFGREICLNCCKPAATCYCHLVTPWDLPLSFVFLVHPCEAKRTVASARIAHLNLINSQYKTGVAFDLDAIIEHSGVSYDNTMLLYPGENAIAIDLENQAYDITKLLEKKSIIVLDGTWHEAKVMYRENQWMHDLQKISFENPGQSQFIVRKQPHNHCLSTIEAVGKVLIHSGLKKRCEITSTFLSPFQHMVQQQIAYEEME